MNWLGEAGGPGGGVSAKSSRNLKFFRGGGWLAPETGAEEAGRTSPGTGRKSGGPPPEAGWLPYDVVFTFIGTIVAGDPGHPLSRVQNS